MRKGWRKGVITIIGQALVDYPGLYEAANIPAEISPSGRFAVHRAQFNGWIDGEGFSVTVVAIGFAAIHYMPHAQAIRLAERLDECPAFVGRFRFGEHPGFRRSAKMGKEFFVAYEASK